MADDSFPFKAAEQFPRKLPERKAFFLIKQGNESSDKYLKLDGLNVRFHVKNLMDNLTPTADFAICNLNRTEAEYITKLFSYYSNKTESREIRFYAGYDSDVFELFDGDVLRTVFSPPPDIWISFQALHDYNLLVQPTEWMLKGSYPLKFIFAEVARRLKLVLKYDATSGKMIKDFTASGSVKTLMQQLAQLDSTVFVWRIGKTIYVADKNPKDFEQKKATWRINEKTGMLEIPQFDPYGATVTTVLNPFIVPGQYAILESRFQPSGNGKYQILSVEHQGELRGNQFETKIRLFRDNTKK